MKITLVKMSDHWRAECIDLPGTSPAGVGKTKEMALACMFHGIIFSGKWIQYWKKEDPLEINGVRWKMPKSWKNAL